MAKLQIEVSELQLEEMVNQLKKNYNITEVTDPELCMQFLLQNCADQARWLVDVLGDSGGNSVVDEMLEMEQVKECMILGEDLD